jgi:hypothetical protein
MRPMNPGIRAEGEVRWIEPQQEDTKDWIPSDSGKSFELGYGNCVKELGGWNT